MKTENRDGKPRKFAWRKSVWSVVLLAVSLTAQTALAGPTKEDIASLKEDLEVYTVQYAKEVNAILEKHEKLFPYAELHAGYLKAKEGAKFTASREGLFGYKTLVSLAYKFAYDKAKNTHTASTAIIKTLDTHYAKPLCDVLKIYLQWKTNFLNELHEADGKYRRVSRERIVKFSSQVRKETDPLRERWELSIYGEIEKAFANHNRERGLYSSIWENVGLDNPVSQTKSYYDDDIETIYKVFSRDLSAITEKMSGAIIVDGGIEELAKAPLPLGDITDTKITLGGGVWTAEEIYKMTGSYQKRYLKARDKNTDLYESVILDYHRNLLQNERVFRLRVIDAIVDVLETLTP